MKIRIYREPQPWGTFNLEIGPASMTGFARITLNSRGIAMEVGQPIPEHWENPEGPGRIASLCWWKGRGFTRSIEVIR